MRLRMLSSPACGEDAGQGGSPSMAGVRSVRHQTGSHLDPFQLRASSAIDGLVLFAVLRDAGQRGNGPTRMARRQNDSELGKTAKYTLFPSQMGIACPVGLPWVVRRCMVPPTARARCRTHHHRLDWGHRIVARRLKWMPEPYREGRRCEMSPLWEYRPPVDFSHFKWRSIGLGVEPRSPSSFPSDL